MEENIQVFSRWPHLYTNLCLFVHWSLCPTLVGFCRLCALLSPKGGSLSDTIGSTVNLFKLVEGMLLAFAPSSRNQ